MDCSDDDLVLQGFDPLTDHLVIVGMAFFTNVNAIVLGTKRTRAHNRVSICIIGMGIKVIDLGFDHNALDVPGVEDLF